MKVTVGTISGAIVAVLISMVTDEILKILLTIGSLGILIFLLFYASEFWISITGGLASIILWILATILDPTLQIQLLVGLLVLTSIVESIWTGLMTIIVSGVWDGLVSITSGILSK